MALVWLHAPVPRQALPRWRACQQSLFDTLRHLGADRLATDAARVLRLVGTCNSRSGTFVEAITPVAEVWDFEVLAEEILPLARAEIVALRLERAKRRGQGRMVHPPSRFFTRGQLVGVAPERAAELLHHRWFGTLPDGQRDLWMLLAGTAISYLVPAPIVRREIVALAREVTGGRWSERETASRMGTLIRNAERAARGLRIEYRGHMVDPRYRFRTDTIVEMLEITEAEMRACGFRQLVSSEIRREFDRQRWHERREAAGGVTRTAYLKHSLSTQKPWETQGISRRTWYRRQDGTTPSRCMVA